jgi:hypothetical protein
LRYLRDSRDLPLTLQADGTGVIYWWIDASFAVHPDMRSHTGATMSMGAGSIFSVSRRQRLNTRSSTEAELVGVNDVMPLVLWTRLFLMGQGYTVKDNVVFQDNQSAMLLENNGKMSSSKRTRHLEIRYFFVTDNINKKNLRVEYCPTDDMLADFFTKPLQGAKFKRFRARILNLPYHDVPVTRKECVATSVNGAMTNVNAIPRDSDHKVHLADDDEQSATSWIQVVRRRKVSTRRGQTEGCSHSVWQT